ncbi:MAG: MBL fold metallo-hydrolase [Acidimicrobiia bacterium]
MLALISKHSRAVVSLAVAVAVLIAGGVWFMYNLPDSLVAAVIERTVSSAQRSDTFEQDGLYVITTGTGAPLPDAERVGPQTVVVAGDQVLVFDSGPGSTRQLELIMPDVSSVDALFFTHYHSDHIGDTGELLLKRWGTSGRPDPLPIYGPPGVEEVVAGFESAYQLDKVYRVDHHGEDAMPSSGFGGEAIEFDLGSDLTSSDVVYEHDGVEVIAFNVDHFPVFPAVGYRVNYHDRSVVITGDTIYTDSLIDHSMGADVLVSEALNHEMSDMVADAGRELDNNVTTVAEDIQDYHITPEEAAVVAREAEIPFLLITHVLPPVPTSLLVNPFLRDARAVYDGDIRMANDGTMVFLPVDSDDHSVSELLK